MVALVGESVRHQARGTILVGPQGEDGHVFMVTGPTLRMRAQNVSFAWNLVDSLSGAMFSFHPERPVDETGLEALLFRLEVSSGCLSPRPSLSLPPSPPEVSGPLWTRGRPHALLPSGPCPPAPSTPAWPCGSEGVRPLGTHGTGRGDSPGPGGEGV